LERASLIASRGFLAFTDELAEKTADMAATLYRKGTLPAPLKREFVDQLLDEGKCICGTPLVEHAETWEHVKDWRQRAGLQAVETAWQQLSGQIAPIAGARLEFRGSLETIVKRISAERDRVGRLEESMSELDGQLKDSRLEDVQQLELKRIDLDKRIRIKQERTGSLKSSLERIQKEITHKTAERSRAQVTDELVS
jgi:DNA sulfur modification protein DndD